MPDYRLYTVGADGRFCDVAALEFATDDEACTIAAVRLGRDPAIEVWQGARLVARVTADGIQMANKPHPGRVGALPTDIDVVELMMSRSSTAP